MALPRVIVHNSVSLDERVEGFQVDIGLHYEIAGRFGADVHLAGSDTILAAPQEPEPADGRALRPPTLNPNDTRPLLAVPDSRGRIRNWWALRNAGYWRDVLALVTHDTPGEYLDFLTARHVPYLAAGCEHVDLREALETLYDRCNARTVLVDSGGTLVGLLVSQDLVDEISLLVVPTLVDGMGLRSLFGSAQGRATDLMLRSCEALRDGVVWLRYGVARG
jgi:2,5-diamino-6-(ribosylamino)-4(3H)-pyrimidinone 5'-phosphate reductase